MEIFKNTVFASDGKTGKTSMSGMSETQVGPPAQYGGSSDQLNPEELLVAAVNSCLMIVFFHFADKSQVDVLSYTSEAEGKVEKTKNGLRFTNVDVVAKVSLADADSAQKIREITQLTEKYCLVSNSLACHVQYNVQVDG
ncbi:MAG: OsmC family protein [Planctomycetes bacterium]|nr:OsmC family protein [Planctomycetota bacterium]